VVVPLMPLVLDGLVVYCALQHGKLKSVRIATARDGASKGYAYVEYESEVSQKHLNFGCRN